MLPYQATWPIWSAPLLSTVTTGMRCCSGWPGMLCIWSTWIKVRGPSCDGAGPCTSMFMASKPAVLLRCAKTTCKGRAASQDGSAPELRHGIGQARPPIRSTRHESHGSRWRAFQDTSSYKNEHLPEWCCVSGSREGLQALSPGLTPENLQRGLADFMHHAPVCARQAGFRQVLFNMHVSAPHVL